jgi:hypothetical protein
VVSPPALIRVTAVDIALGVRESCEECPIALAIVHAIGDMPANVSVSAWDARLYRHEDTLDAALPQEARAFIERFDLGDTVEPFEFDLTWREATY